MDSKLFVALIIVNAVVYTVVALINGLAGASFGTSGLFLNSTGDISYKYYLEITPSGWTFSIWGVIYIWEAVWIIYSIVNIFRKTEQGPLYLNPIVLSPVFFLIFTLNMCLNLAWLFLFDRQVIEVAFVCLFFIAFTLYICLFFSYRNLDRNLGTLAKYSPNDIWLIRIFVQNGISTYATWTTIATLLNLAMTIAYRSDPAIPQSTASTVALSFLLVEITVFVVFDFFFLDRYTRYTLTPYCVIVFALTGSIAKNYTDGARNSIFTAILLAIAIALLIVKCVLCAWRHIRGPILPREISDSNEELKKTKLAL